MSLLAPYDLDFDTNIVVKTKGNNVANIQKGMSIESSLKFLSKFIDFPNVKFNYHAGIKPVNQDYKIDLNSRFFLKKGAINKLFSQYDEFISPRIMKLPSGKIVDREIRYVIANKELFKFKDLENSNYDFNLKTRSENNNGINRTTIEDLSIFSEDSGFKLNHEMQIASKRFNKWSASGALFLKNYPSIVEFSSGYIYRLGKFKILSDQARKLYVDVNKNFLKSIADDPKSDSNNLSLKYSVDSRNIQNAKIGNVRIYKIPELYTLTLYQKLFHTVGNEGNILKKIKNIIPNINENDPILRGLLPKIAGNKKIIKQIDKSIPNNLKKTIKEIFPKKLTKNFLKNF